MLFYKQQFYRNSEELQSLRRLQIDLQDEQLKELQDDTCEITMKMVSDLLQIIMTPKIGPYQNKNFSFNLDFRINYPYSPPSIFSISDIHHPNIDYRNKQFYLQFIDKQNWKPIYGLFEIIKAMRQTLVNVDFTYIPNQNDCIILAQTVLCPTNQNDDKRLDLLFEMSDNFKINFELNQQSNFIGENEQQQKENSSLNFSQQPTIINLLKTQRHSQNDKIFYIKQKN
ncbi:unnamed protein product [Paramecium sonneborni]|uniref:UBC core domain-containing protein n=1 Tax=Paramecium sonneborni TaxID=65129 RepID=A0A8S1L929_9CILI|nr:unnamed protein product [Paramecium sonneborni]